jgi:hypothetical protein
MSDEHTHLRRCEQLLKLKFPQYVPADLGTRCLLEIGDFSWKLWCVVVASILGVPSSLFLQASDHL